MIQTKRRYCKFGGCPFFDYPRRHTTGNRKRRNGTGYHGASGNDGASTDFGTTQYRNVCPDPVPAFNYYLLIFLQRGEVVGAVPTRYNSYSQSGLNVRTNNYFIKGPYFVMVSK